jgi:hypothetical protein
MHLGALAALINDIGIPTTAGRTAAIRQHVLENARGGCQTWP